MEDERRNNQRFTERAADGDIENMRRYLNGDVPVDINFDNGAPLIRAAEAGKTEAVMFLLANGADVHIRQDFALIAAARGGHAETVKALLQAGARADAYNFLALTEALDRDQKSTLSALFVGLSNARPEIKEIAAADAARFQAEIETQYRVRPSRKL